MSPLACIFQQYFPTKANLIEAQPQQEKKSDAKQQLECDSCEFKCTTIEFMAIHKLRHRTLGDFLRVMIPDIIRCLHLDVINDILIPYAEIGYFDPASPLACKVTSCAVVPKKLDHKDDVARDEKAVDGVVADDAQPVEDEDMPDDEKKEIDAAVAESLRLAAETTTHDEKEKKKEVDPDAVTEVNSDISASSSSHYESAWTCGIKEPVKMRPVFEISLDTLEVLSKFKCVTCGLVYWPCEVCKKSDGGGAWASNQVKFTELCNPTLVGRYFASFTKPNRCTNTECTMHRPSAS